MDEQDGRSRDPLRTDAGPAPRVPAARPDASRPGQRLAAEGPLVMLVDGTEAFRRAMEDALGGRGFRVQISVSTLQARRRVRQAVEERHELPALILVNEAVPGIGWKKLSDLLERDQGYEPARVVGYTCQGWFPEEGILGRVEERLAELAIGASATRHRP